MSQATMNVARWSSLFRELGLSDAQMQRWHDLFEARYPEGHQAFLIWLGLEEVDIQKIRQQSGA
ncbi:hypothetical protein [Magnetococcus sp. PR-3]|uniref:hypothetical protein n=1 Tax=Magnetococcus sp. PR-3 TaxID=3120355 RepID=UPI002FCE21BA